MYGCVWTVLFTLCWLPVFGADNRVYRIGTNQSVPMNYWEDNGPVGFAVDVLNEAAGRTGTRLKWIRVPADPIQAITSGEVELWPMVADLEERRQWVHLSRPWWQSDRVLVYQEGSAAYDFEHLGQARLAFVGAFSPQHQEYLARLAGEVVQIRGTPDVLNQLCLGRVDAVVVDYRNFQRALLRRPPDCRDAVFNYTPAQQLSQAFSIGARFGLERVAARLSGEINAMYTDGSFARIAQKWHLVSAQDETLLRWTLDTQRRSARLQWGLLLASILVVTVGGLLILARRARRAAEQGSQARSRFLAKMSHEIRTPLNGILGMTELVLGTRLNAVQRDYISVAKSSADNLLVILNDILDFSKIEAEKLELETVDFAPEENVASAVKIFGLLAAQKSVQLTVRIDPEVPEIVSGDPVRFRQILVNLVGNAVKFTDRGRIHVELRLDPAPSSAGRVPVTVSVKDTGIGIPADKLAIIFEAFSQASGSMTRRFGGTGLGLAISRELVRLMGGTLSVESTPGAGSTFYFTALFAAARSPRRLVAPLTGRHIGVLAPPGEERDLLIEMLTSLDATISDPDTAQRPDILIAAEEYDPAATLYPDVPVLPIGEPVTVSGEEILLSRPIFRKSLAEAIHRVLRGPLPKDAVAAPGGTALRILVVEDNIINQKVVQRMLDVAGHQITIAANGREALKCLLTRTFDAVLMDVQMPEMTGTRVTQVWRRYETRTGRSPVPIIGLTAMSMKGDREDCLRSGMNDCLSKPIQRQVLLDTLDHYAAAGVASLR